jgi:DeoR family transcriptional regulator of aga operon
LSSEDKNIKMSTDLLPEDRRKIIRELLQSNGSVRTNFLAEQMNVNPATVRRDLREMAEEEKIRLVHGGAVIASPVRPVTTNFDLIAKRSANREAKTQIAKKAINLISDGDIIALTSGSTVELIVQYLPNNFKALTIVTLSLNVAYLAAQLPYVNLLVPGGTFRRSSHAFIGSDAKKFISTLRIDKGFFGAQAVDVNGGFTESNLAEAEMNLSLTQVCAHMYLTADSSKFGNVALGHICDLDEFDGLIVDDNIPETVRSWAAATGVPLI